MIELPLVGHRTTRKGSCSLYHLDPLRGVREPQRGNGTEELFGGYLIYDPSVLSFHWLTNLQEKKYFSHCTDNKTKSQQNCIACPRPQSSKAAKWRFELRLQFQACIFTLHNAVSESRVGLDTWLFYSIIIPEAIYYCVKNHPQTCWLKAVNFFFFFLITVLQSRLSLAGWFFCWSWQ